MLFKNPMIKEILDESARSVIKKIEEDFKKKMAEVQEEFTKIFDSAQKDITRKFTDTIAARLGSDEQHVFTATMAGGLMRLKEEHRGHARSLLEAEAAAY